jgi:hypothetical protein
VVLVMVLFRCDFTALSGIWEGAPLAATCTSTSVLQCEGNLWYLMVHAFEISIISDICLIMNMMLCSADVLREISTAHV